MENNPILNSPIMGYAHHRILLDESGTPVDYEFLEVNGTFEKLTGVKADAIIGETVTDAIPGIEKAEFDWISYYGEVALNGGEKEFEQYSEPLNKWYRVHVYSTEKLFFTTMFIDITASKQKEENLRFKSTIVENVNDSIVVTDTQFKITYINSAAEKLYGYTPEELIGKSPDIFNAEAMSQKIQQELYETVSSGKVYESTSINRRKDGGLFHCEYKVQPITDESGKIISFVGVQRDVTASKKQTEELEAFFSVNLDLLCIADIEGNFIKTNEAWSRILGYSTEELNNRKFLEFVHPDDMDATLGAMAKLGKGDDVLEFTNRYKCKDGSYRFIEWRSHPKGNVIYAAARDVTEKVLSERQLLSDKQQIDMFFNQSLHGFFMCMLDEPIEWNEKTDKKKMIEYVLDRQKMTRVNQAMLDQYGAREKEFVGITVRELFKHDLEHAREIWTGLFDKGKWHVETYEQKMDGTPIIIKGDYICLYDEKGRITGHFGVQVDVTEEKQHERELAFQNALMKTQMEVSLDGILFVDEKDTIRFFNQRFADIWGIPDSVMSEQSGEEALEHVLPKLTDPDGFAQRIHDLSENKHEKSYDEIYLKDGKILERYSSPTFGTHDEYYGRIWYYRDITERKNAEIQLRESEERYRTLFETMTEGCQIIGKNYEYLFINNTAEKQGRKTKEELVGKKMADVYPGIEITDMFAKIQTCMEDKSSEILENLFAYEDGSQRWFQLRMKPVPQGVFILSLDITEQKEMEKTLQENEQKLRSVIESARSVALVVTDLHAVVEEFSPGAEEIFGYSQEEMIGAPVATLHEPAEAALLSEYVEKLEKTHEGFTIEPKLIRKNGEVFPALFTVEPLLDSHGNLKGTLGVSVDISQLKDTEEKLRQSQEQYQSLVNNVPGITFRCKADKDWTMLFLTTQIDSITGYTAEELLGNAKTSYGELTHPDDQQFVAQSVEAGIHANAPWEIEYRVRHKDGSLRWVYEKGIAIKDEDGHVQYLDGFILDVTDRKQAEEELKISEERYNLAISGTGVGLWDWDMINNTVFFSEQWKKMLGYEDHEIPNKFSGWQNLWHPDDVDRIEKHINDYLDGKSKSYEVEHRLQAKDGSWRWILTRGEIEKDSAGQPIRWTGTNIDITQRKHAEEALEYNLSFQTIVSEIAAQFVKTTEETYDTDIHTLLKKIGTTFHIDRSYLFIFSPNYETMTNTHEWCAHGIPSQMDQIQNQRVDLFPWFMSQIQSGHTVHIPLVSQLPAGAAAEKEEFTRQNIQSLLCVPIVTDNRIWGFIGFDAVTEWRTWDRSEIRNLRLLAQLLGETLLKKEAREKLHSATTRLTLATQAGGVGVWEFDPVKNSLSWDDQMYKLYGISREQFTNAYEAWEAYTHQDDLARVNDEVQAALRGENKFDTEFRIVWPDGSIHHIRGLAEVLFDSHGNPVNVIGTNWDITEEKENREQLALSEKRYKGLIESQTDLIVRVDTDNRLTYVNNAYCKTFGKNQEELLGNSFTPLVHEDDRENTMREMDKLFTPPYRVTLEQRAFTEKGWRWLSWEDTAILDENDTVVEIQGVGRDITERKQAEEDLKKLKMEYESVLNTQKEMICRFTPDTTITFVNKAYCTAFGTNKEELLGTPFLNLVPEEEQEGILQHIKTLKETNEPITYEHMAIMPNGSITWQEWTDYVISSENNRVTELQSVGYDITERKEAEAALLYERDLFTAGPVFTIEWDPVDNWPIRNVSRNVEEVLGYTPQYMQSDEFKYAELIHPDDIERIGEEVSHNISNHIDTYEQSYRLKCRDGEYRWFYDFTKLVRNDTGELTAIRGYMYDQTHQKESEQALESERLRLAGIIEGTHVGTWEWNVQTGETVFNERWAEIVGYTLDEISPVSIETWMNLAHPDDLKGSEKQLEEHFRGERSYYDYESRMKHKNGEWVWVLDRGKVVTWTKDGKPLLMLGTHQDITERKEAEEEMREINNELEIATAQANSMAAEAEMASAAKSEFLANMSHEIRTPLNGVIGFTDLLKSTPLSPLQQQYVDNANVSGHTLLGIINDILDFSKIEAGMLHLEMIQTDMIELLENSIDIVKYQAGEKNLELLLHIDQAMPRFAVTDPIRLKQILANLLGNAVKFTTEGEVELKVQYEDIEDGRGKLSFFVRDTGVGITEEQKEKLFKAFSQADSSTTRKFGGTGLGLIISDLIAKKLGGKILVDSTQGEGTTFYFEFVAETEHGEMDETDSIENIERCLIIDDNANNRLILEGMLKNWDITSEACDNGLTALKLLETSKPFDVIICDYHMPYIDGLETIRMIREKLHLSTEKQPIILLHSSADDEKLYEQYDELGVRFRLIKPVKSTDLYSYLCKLHDPQATPNQPKILDAPLGTAEGSGSATILIAEDVELNMTLIKAHIDRLFPKASVHEAVNGIEAVQLAREITPDIILMDIQMPEMDGNDATREIRALEKELGGHIPIIALTAGALKEEREKSISAGMDDFLTKPIEKEKLRTMLTKYWPDTKDTPAADQKSDTPEAGDEDSVHFSREKFLERTLGKEKLLMQTIEIALRDFPQKIELLNEAIDAEKIDDIRRYAHLLKGAAANLTCTRFSEIAQSMEELASAEDNMAKLQEMNKELQKEWEIVKDLLEN
ncbi:PAS domain S-box protein [Chitinivibrio alkaliphilus]|uniref:histidine kinase n=1 Tax=Chitinivibrio alkaliphilus ACht1 TaxID=1313304 RepID=U7D713_9BACT|nr:PAS domain S-box protein [Chitinivibrio alkaliphilus]ERP30862.1 multi-sensor hybrid histidine kinase [Chitinivibrio alkaliphilus ACht1]